MYAFKLQIYTLRSIRVFLINNYNNQIQIEIIIILILI